MNLRRQRRVIVLVRFPNLAIVTAITATGGIYPGGRSGDIAYTAGNGTKGEPSATALASTLATTPTPSSAPVSVPADIHAT
jgi:hypothetical protein